MKRPQLYAGQALVGFAFEKSGGATQIGIAVSRDVKTAVARNRVKRRLREISRVYLLAPESPLSDKAYNLVLLGRSRVLTVPFQVLVKDAHKLLEALTKAPVRAPRALPSKPSSTPGRGL